MMPEDVVERVSAAIERASCPGREGPFGGYDYGHENDDPPKDGRYVIRDFRDLSSPTCGAWLHQTNDRDLHEAMFDRMTKHHIARAAIEAMREPTDAMLAGACEKHIPGRPMHDTTPPWPDERYRTEDECPRFVSRRKIWSRMIDASLTQPHPTSKEYTPTNGIVAASLPSPVEIDSDDYARVEANAALIVAAVNALPGLLDRIAELEAGMGEQAIEAADYLISCYKRLWAGGVIRDLAEAEAAWANAKEDARPLLSPSQQEGKG